MTKQTKQTAPVAAKAAANAAPKAKVVLLAISPESMTAAARAIVAAEVATQRQAVALLQGYGKAVAGLKVKAMSAVQYDRQFRPTFDAELAAKVKRNALKDSSAKVASSRAKSVVLALANGLKPVVGETMSEFRERASAWLPTAKLPDGSSVWEQAGKRGRKLGSGKKAAGGKPEASAANVRDAEGGTDERRDMAAALILTHGNRDRAARLCLALANYGAEFDRWVETILPEKPAPKAKPDTAMAAAMAKASSAKTA